MVEVAKTQTAQSRLMSVSDEDTYRGHSAPARSFTVVPAISALPAVVAVGPWPPDAL
jgi:hypothetical protein